MPAFSGYQCTRLFENTLVKIVGGKFEYDYRLLMIDVYDVVRCSTMLIIISLRRLITDHVS